MVTIVDVNPFTQNISPNENTTNSQLQLFEVTINGRVFEHLEELDTSAPSCRLRASCGVKQMSLAEQKGLSGLLAAKAPQRETRRSLLTVVSGKSRARSLPTEVSC